MRLRWLEFMEQNKRERKAAQSDSSEESPGLGWSTDLNTRERKWSNSSEISSGMSNFKSSQRAKNSLCSYQTEWKDFINTRALKRV